ncbi:tetratricopeptide repeat protein [Actinokineospora terrae]|uniref:Tetratricopeptide repeat-containing protein n=1 Tax=Actinokineospora terrae TaxID=155974 RepID=A0A1H9MBE0_9PSEU|nr:tetratricopeptide repeat protein [Actinokineospora terrae]SER20789.1 hypothetical protein SAMN04487818_10260 [Actinokineospora terrae]
MPEPLPALQRPVPEILAGLDTDAREGLRALSRVPGPVDDITARAVTGLSPATADHVLRRLTMARLLERDSVDGDIVDGDIVVPDHVITAATRGDTPRVLDHLDDLVLDRLVTTARHAATLAWPARDLLPPATPDTGVPYTQAWTLEEPEHARLWLDRAQPTLMTVLRRGAARSRHRAVVLLADALHTPAILNADTATEADLVELCLPAARALGDPALLTSIATRATRRWIADGDLDRARALLVELTRWAERDGDANPEILVTQASLLAADGEHDTALALLDAVVEAHDQSGDARGEAQALIQTGLLLLALDRHGSAVGPLARAVSLFHGILDGDHYHRGRAALALAQAQLGCGFITAAKSTAILALEAMTAAGSAPGVDAARTLITTITTPQSTPDIP